MGISCSVALDTLSIVYMLILLYSLRQRARREPSSRRYFWLVAAICVFLSLDIIYLLLSGRTSLWGRAALKAVKSLYFCINALIVWLWTGYLGQVCAPDRRGRAPLRAVFTCFFFADLLLVGADLFTGILFRISPQGSFLVGSPAIWLFTLFNYLSILLAGLLLIRSRKSLRRGQFYPLLLFPLPPFCAELVQIFFRPCSLLCTYAVSALLIFQVSQNASIYTDELTGLANRRLLDESLQKWFSAPRGALVCGIMIDLDGLKQINDAQGHLGGDRALCAMAETLRCVRRKGLVAARYGGDEFVLAWRAGESSDLSRAEQELAAACQKENLSRPLPEQIFFSWGSFCCRDTERLSPEAFLREADARMYRQKSAKNRDACPGTP
ncbi:GGDEF domain-containing protein [Anaerofilum sp. BX8]|uniref:GGDEF domain-containing protein n=1 Tax=Anaerofilum hominis TaxID=2763016 RepID=A0A923KXC5_9FIRM|nr:GGDEF domain-containing protein [Anaerofilum hominis]